MNQVNIFSNLGTGSGCLSVNISQNLDKGHLYTFEFNKERATKLKENFKKLNLENKITITHRDVVQNGFILERENLKKESHSRCDSIFIDLPSPWLIIEHAKKVLVKNGNFVSFSPCIEQVAETYKFLVLNSFINIKMYECLYRNFNYTRTINVSVPELNGKRKGGEEIRFVEKELPTYSSKADMRGHTGYLVVANII
jgi:tRNA (adenine57-N1/adenine58-N1)-methyltransferase